MALSLIQQVRLLTQDTAVGFYFTTDEEIQFFLDRNNQNVNRASLEVARVILLQLSMWSANESIDIFTISGGSKSAEQYRLALEMFIRNPQLNPVYNSVNGYAGGISISDMQANSDALDNNSVTTPLAEDTSVSVFGV
jgi:hypothetical protein